MFDLIHPTDRREVTEYFDSVPWGFGISTPVEYRFRQNDGSWKLVESTGRAIDDPRFGPAIVVTSRASAAKEFSFENVIKNDILRSAIFDRAEIGLALFSLSGHFIKCNTALREMLDHPGSELEDMALSEFIFPYDAQNDRRALADVLGGKRGHYQFENGYLTPDGERVWGQLTIVSIASGDNGSEFLMGIFEDPTKQKQVQAIVAQDESIRTNANENSGSNILDFKSWKIDKGLICEN